MSEARQPFEDFYADKFEWFARLAYLFVGDAHVADDLVQEAMMRVQRKFPALESPTAYTRTVLLNLVRRHGRKESQRRAAEGLVVPKAELPDDAVEILQLVHALPPRQRAVIILRYYEGLTEAEIAAALKCRPGTVKSLAARALAQLRRKVKQ
jgi:RNA polymerase sigma factor (sigma-70 family)